MIIDIIHNVYYIYYQWSHWSEGNLHFSAFISVSSLTVTRVLSSGGGGQGEASPQTSQNLQALPLMLHAVNLILL